MVLHLTYLYENCCTLNISIWKWVLFYFKNENFILKVGHYKHHILENRRRQPPLPFSNIVKIPTRLSPSHHKDYDHLYSWSYVASLEDTPSHLQTTICVSFENHKGHPCNFRNHINYLYRKLIRIEVHERFM